jgi:hypothetical protein
MDIKKNKTISTLIAVIFLCMIGAMSAVVADEEMRETDQAKQLFLKSIKMLLAPESIPTYQGTRNVTVFQSDGIRRNFRIRDGFCAKYGGYHARIDNPGNPPEMGNPGKNQFMPPPGPPPPGAPPPGNPGPEGEGRGRGFMERFRNREMNPGDDQLMMPLQRLLDFNRPDMEPIFAEQLDTAQLLIKDSSHLVIKGPVESKVASRKTMMIEVSPRNYRGGKMRLWLDKEKGINLKKQRIDSNGRLIYSTEYEKIEFVADESFEFKKPPEDRPDMQNMMQPGPMHEKPIPPYYMEPENPPVAPILSGVTGFQFIKARRMPHPILKGTHFIFSDGLNSISVFYFDTSRFPPGKDKTVFSQKLGEKLDSLLPYPVLLKKDENSFILITADIQKDDLKRISAAIALKNTQQIKKMKEKMGKKK